MRTVVAYISGHGYGHVARMAELIRELQLAEPQINIRVRTTAPHWILTSRSAGTLCIDDTAIDTGVVEDSNALQVDIKATVASVDCLFQSKKEIVDREVRALDSFGAELVIADVPYLAGRIAAALGIPCIGVANFTWDWIYEPYFDALGTPPGLRKFVHEGYDCFTRFLRLPFSHEFDFNTRKPPLDVPLIARVSLLNLEDARKRIGIDDGQTVALVNMRGRDTSRHIESMARSTPNVLFLHMDADVAPLDNLIHVSVNKEFGFCDAVRASDVVVSKLGYGILADCIANDAAIVWLKRNDFREDVLLVEAAKKFVRSCEITEVDLTNANWKRYLERVQEQDLPPSRLQTDGARICAEYLMSGLRR